MEHNVMAQAVAQDRGLSRRKPSWRGEKRFR
jgi:hypothetical protein